MSEKNIETDKNEEIPAICTYRGLKPEVFRRAHQRANELEVSGKVLLTDDWKTIVHRSWKEVKAEAKKICSGNPPTGEESDEKLVPDAYVPEEKPPNIDNDQQKPVEEVEQEKSDEALI